MDDALEQCSRQTIKKSTFMTRGHRERKPLLYERLRYNCRKLKDVMFLLRIIYGFKKDDTISEATHDNLTYVYDIRTMPVPEVPAK